MSKEFQASNNHWTVKGFKENMTTKQYRELLLSHPQPMRNGQLCEWKGRYLGAGVYEVSLWDKKA